MTSFVPGREAVPELDDVPVCVVVTFTPLGLDAEVDGVELDTGVDADADDADVDELFFVRREATLPEDGSSPNT